MGQVTRRAILAMGLALALALPAVADSDIDGRVQLLLDKIGQDYELTDAGNYQIELDMAGSRTQYVYIMSGTEKYGGIEIREIWSNAGYFPEEPDQATLVDLMTESGMNKIGCWALEDQEDGSYLLYYTIKLPVSFTASDLRMMLGFAAEIADAREAQFFGSDDN
jgi:hypothetical protein